MVTHTSFFEHFALLRKDIRRDTWNIGSEAEQLGIECVEDDLVFHVAPSSSSSSCHSLYQVPALRIDGSITASTPGALKSV